MFHLRDIRWERPRFLSKSFLAFVTFNFISYSLLAAEVLTTNVAGTSPKEKVRVSYLKTRRTGFCRMVRGKDHCLMS